MFQNMTSVPESSTPSTWAHDACRASTGVQPRRLGAQVQLPPPRPLLRCSASSSRPGLDVSVGRHLCYTAVAAAPPPGTMVFHVDLGELTTGRRRRRGHLIPLAGVVLLVAALLVLCMLALVAFALVLVAATSSVLLGGLLGVAFLAVVHSITFTSFLIIGLRCIGFVAVSPMLVPKAFEWLLLIELAFYFWYRLKRRRWAKVVAKAPRPGKAERWAQFNLVFKHSPNIREFFRGWFVDRPPFEDIKRGNIMEWMAWAFFYQKRERLTRVEEQEMLEMLSILDKKHGITFDDGYNEGLKSLRLSLDQHRTIHRPLIYYAVIYSMDMFARCALWGMGFSKGSIGSGNPVFYWYRPAPAIGTAGPGVLSWCVDLYERFKFSYPGVAKLLGLRLANWAHHSPLSGSDSDSGSGSGSDDDEEHHDSSDSDEEHHDVRVRAVGRRRATTTGTSAEGHARRQPRQRQRRTTGRGPGARSGSGSGPGLTSLDADSAFHERRERSLAHRAAMGRFAAAAALSPGLGRGDGTGDAPRNRQGSTVGYDTDSDPKSDLPDAIIFFHGIGIGVTAYLQLIWAILQLRQAVYVVEVQSISTRLVKKVPSQAQVVGAVATMLHAKGHKRASLVGHSFGSIFMGWVMKAMPAAVHASVFVDPVVFMLAESDVCWNFMYRKPQSLDQLATHYMASTELHVSHTIARHFFWQDNILWYEQLANPAKTSVLLSGRDAIVPATKARQYLHNHHIHTMYHPKLTHGGFLHKPAARMQVVEALAVQHGCEDELPCPVSVSFLRSSAAGAAAEGLPARPRWDTDSSFST